MRSDLFSAIIDRHDNRISSYLKYWYKNLVGLVANGDFQIHVLRNYVLRVRPC